MNSPAPLSTNWLPIKLRVEDYLLLDKAGAFETYGRTELIEGEIVYMNAQYRPHALAKMKLYDAIRDGLCDLALPFRALVEASIALSDHDVLEPDLLLTSEPEGEGLVPLATIPLVIEVADTTLRNDLGRKLTIYAREGIPEYWVVDVENRVIHQHWRPAGAAYGECRQIAFGTAIDAATVAGLTVPTDTL